MTPLFAFLRDKKKVSSQNSKYDEKKKFKTSESEIIKLEVCIVLILTFKCLKYLYTK